MATLYTELSGRETTGEKALYSKLKSKLPDEYMVWHNRVPPEKDREIDFVVLHPTYGLWVIEVKDWVANQISTLDEQRCVIVKDGKPTTERNPLYQSWQNSKFLMGILEKKDNLRHKAGVHAGKLLLPINHFAVLTNITVAEINERNIADKWPSKRVWTADFVNDAYTSDTEWEKRLLNSREYVFDCNLNGQQVDAVKAAIGVPVVFSPTSGNASGTLDDHQMRLARHEIDKQIVIEGPAGSGKSIVLLKRALHTHETYPHWQIGIICFNALMANYLRTLLSLEDGAIDLRDSIDIYDVYDWVRMGLPNIRKHYSKNLPPDEAIKKALDESNGQVQKQYDALLVDEGQDSTDNMLRLYRAMLRDSNGAFTFCFDRRQEIYDAAGLLTERLQKHGFNIAKEKELVKQQRSVLVLLALAFYEKMKQPSADPAKVMHGVLELCDRMFFNVKNLVLAAVTGLGRLFGLGNAGAQIDFKKELEKAVLVRVSQSAAEMVDTVVGQIALEHSRGSVAYGDFLIIFPVRHFSSMGNFGQVDLPALLQSRMQEKQVSFLYVDKDTGTSFDGQELCTEWDNRRTAKLATDTVKIMTIHASKGYDASNVFIVGFDGIDSPKSDSRKAELGYVAITRAKKHCEIHYCMKTPAVSALLEVMATLR